MPWTRQASLGKTPVDYEDIREIYLPEREFRGRTDHHKSHYALTVAAMVRGGVKPDLLGEVAWWRTDDFWVLRETW